MRAVPMADAAAARAPCRVSATDLQAGPLQLHAITAPQLVRLDSKLDVLTTHVGGEGRTSGPDVQRAIDHVLRVDSCISWSVPRACRQCFAMLDPKLR